MIIQPSVLLAAVKYADFYERALVNGILGTARLPPEDWPEVRP